MTAGLHSKSSMKVLARMGETVVCSYRVPLNWKYAVLKQNSKSLMRSTTGIHVWFPKVSSAIKWSLVIFLRICIRTQNLIHVKI